MVFPAAARSLDQALAADLRRMGARVRMCDPGASSDDCWTPIFEIIPIQAAACARALALGIDPGDFRYASLVTSAEAGFR